MTLRISGVEFLPSPASAALKAGRGVGASAGARDGSDILSGAAAVKKAGHLHGFPASHIDALIAFVSAHNVVFAFRPVNPLATSLIEAGYPTKPLEIKGKSGGLGLIPVDQNLSKAFGNSGKVKKLNAAVAQCITDGHAIAITCPITAQRLSDLERHGAIKVVGGNDASHLTIYSVNGPTYQGILTSAAAAPRSYKLMHGGKEVHFLGKVDEPAKGMPFTADYDLLMFAPHIHDYGAEDMPKLGGRRSSCSPVYESVDPKHAGLVKLMRTNSRSSLAKPGDPGVISPRLHQLLPELNQALGRAPGNALIHHGADTNNPFTVTSDNIPCIFFFPSNVAGWESVAVAKNELGLQTLLQETKNADFEYFSNEKWEKELHPKRNSLTESRLLFSPRSRPEQSKVLAGPDGNDDRNDNNFMRAARKGDIAAVRKWLAGGADVNQTNRHGVTALMRAAEGGLDGRVNRFVVLKILIDNGAAVNVKDNNGVTALMRAAGSGHIVATKLLLAKRANAGDKDKDGATALNLAVRNGHTGTERALLNHSARTAVDRVDSDLMRAARDGDIATVKKMLANGADVN